MENLILRKENITSLELVEQINLFRKQEGKNKELRHDNLLQIIRDEFEEEIGLLKIQETPYIHPQNKQEYPMFILTFSQAKQVLVRESKFVRKAVITYIEKLENQLRGSLSQLDILANTISILQEQERRLILQENRQTEIEERILEVESKIKTKDTTYYTISGYANLNKKQVDKSLALKLGKQCTSICNTRKLHIGKEYDAKYGQVNIYSSTILKEVFNNYFND